MIRRFQRVAFRMILMLIIGCLSTVGWWVFNQYIGNLAVADYLFEPQSVGWCGFAAVMVACSFGLVYIQVSHRLRTRPAPDVAPVPVVVPPVNRYLVAGLAGFSTLLDTLIPPVGVWLTLGWPPTPLHFLAAFVIGGLMGSNVCQLMAIECFIDLYLCAMYVLQGPDEVRPPTEAAREMAKKPQQAAKQSQRPPIPQREPQRRNESPPPLSHPPSDLIMQSPSSMTARPSNGGRQATNSDLQGYEDED